MNDNLKKQIGNRIKAIRKSRGENQTEFAKTVNATLPAVSNWETGKNIPNNERLKAIADIGDMTVEELLYGYQNIKISLDEKQTKNHKKFVDSKNQVWKQEAKLLLPSALSGLLTLGLGFKESSAKAIHDYEAHQERIKALENFGQKYIEANYDNYTYDKYLKDFPNSDPQGFEEYKEKEWVIFKEVLENFWESFDITTENHSWISSRFTNQITDELNEVKKIAVEEGKEHYYVNEVVQPFLDQAAKEFKEYIKDYIDTEE